VIQTLDDGDTDDAGCAVGVQRRVG
jgi:hypothetical protein